MRKETEIQQENFKNLLKLIQENPDLKIVPMVDTEVVANDGFGWWVGFWGKAELGEIYTSDERIYIKDNDYEDLVDEYIDKSFEDVTDKEIEIAEKAIDKLNWIKVILVHITN